MKIRWTAVILILAATLSSLPAAWGLELTVEGDCLSVRAQNVPLGEILRHLSRAGVQVSAPPGLHQRVSADFRNKTMHEGLGTILKPYGYVLFWEREGDDASLRLSEMHVFDPGGSSGAWSGAGEEFALSRDPRDGSLYIQNEILVRASPGADQQLIQETIAGVGGVILEKNETLGIYRARLPESIDIPGFLEMLKTKETRFSAETNRAYPIDFPRWSPTIPPGLENRQDAVAVRPDMAAPVAVFDSGLLGGYGLEESVIASLDAVQPGMPVTDGLGHGTQMAMVAAGAVRPAGAGEGSSRAAPIIPVRAFDDNGVTSNFAIMKGIDFAVQNGARVVSMSWGSETPSPFLEAAMNYADQQGLILVASAGNEPTGKPVYPAAYSSVLGVGALAPDGTPWKQSNHGSFVSVSAPGYAAFPVGYRGEAGLYAGTSIAAAYVANIISGWLTENPHWQKADVVDHLQTQSFK